MKMLWFTLIMAMSSYILSVGHVDGQGYNGCFNSSWSYYSHTHTCIRISSLKRLNWEQAVSECKNYKGGIDGNIVGHLVKIDDEETNSFVKGFVTTASAFYKIGLYYNSTVGDYRWDGFPDEVPKYLNFKDGRLGNLMHAVIRQDGWSHKWTTQRSQFFCEHAAYIQRSTMSCPSTPVNIQNSNSSSTLISCHFYFNNWDSISLFEYGSGGSLVMCKMKDMPCQEITQSENGQTTLSFSGPITVRQTGNWTCTIYNETDHFLDARSCALQAYKPPSLTNCTSGLHPFSLNVSCTTNIYPTALCQFSYQNGNNAMTEITNIFHTHELHGNNQPEKELYYETKCSFGLASQGLMLKTGKVQVQITIHPEMEGINETSTPSAFYQRLEILTIVLPTPEFTINNTKKITSDASTMLSIGYPVSLTCEPKNGNPDVQSTTISCQFPIDQSGDSSKTMSGPLVNLSLQANSTMDGKTCVCWGEHMTGRTNNLTIQWRLDVSDGEDNLGLIIGVVIGAVLFLVILIIVIIVLLRRRRKRTKQNSSATWSAKDNSKNGSDSYAVVMKKKGGKDNLGFCVSEIPYANDVQGAKSEDHTYNNMDFPKPGQDIETDVYQNTDDGPIKSNRQEEELNYADIIIDGVSARPVLKEDKGSRQREKAPKELHEDAVEYTAISLTETMKIKK